MKEKKEFVPFNGHTALPWNCHDMEHCAIVKKDDHGMGHTIVETAAPHWDAHRIEAESNRDFVFEATHSYYPSREIIEKLERDLGSAASLANDAVLAALHPGTKMNIDVVNDLLDRYRATLKEARAFLNKNVKP